MFRAICLSLLVLALAACRSQAPEPADASGFGSTARLDRGLIGETFYLPENADKLPDFGALQRQGVIYARELNVANRPFEQGFPGLGERLEWFAIRYRGGFEVATPGRYAFRLSSDDGSRLLIDDKLVIDNDGGHPERSASGEVDLAAGPHRIEVQYFQGPRMYVALQLYCTAPGGQEAVFPGCGAQLAQPPSAGLALNWVLILVVVLIVGAVILVIVLLGRRRPAPPAG